jgi:hypothetical protein
LKFEKFIPLLKMDEASDGTLHVYGLVTEEKVDLEKEICDYASTKPLYEKRTQERWELTSKIAGMTPSLMAARGQHDPKQAIGAGRSIDFDDALKQIKMGFHIVDREAVKKWKSGVFVGFSQGGDYVAKWDDPVHKGCIRYTADPFEVSSVDSPCLPSALAESMKGRTVTLTKSAGVTEEVPLQILPVDEARLVKAERENTELRETLRKRDLAAKLEKLSDGDRNAIARTCATISLRKGLYEVGELGYLLETLTWLCLQSEWEREIEGDKSKVPDEMREAWSALLETFKTMAAEEADELAASGKGEKGMKITDQAGLTKAAKTIGEHLEKHMEMHKALHEKLEGVLAKDHPILKAHTAMMDHCEKCMKAAKDAGAGDEPEAEKVAPVTANADVEALTKANADLSKKFDDLLAKLAATPAAGAPHTGAAAVAKTANPFDELIEAPAVTH